VKSWLLSHGKRPISPEDDLPGAFPYNNENRKIRKRFLSGDL